MHVDAAAFGALGEWGK